MLIGKRTLKHRIISGLLIVGIVFFCLAPLYWMLVTSLQIPGTEFRLPVELWPSEPSLESYGVVLNSPVTIQSAVVNSFVVSSLAMLGTLLLSSLAAFSIARLRMKRKRLSFFVIQAAGLIPPIIVIAPTFVLIRMLGLLGTLWGLILPNIAYGVPLATLLIAGYFANVPFELEDAARMDGASPLRIFFQIMLPVALPGIFSAGVLSFLGSWGEFMTALTVSLGNPAARTVPVAVLSLSQAFELQWTWIGAATMLSLVPVIVAVVLFQRLIIDGLTQGATR